MKINIVIHNFKEKYEKLIIALLYFFLIAGGLWHLLGVLQTVMRVLAAPLIVGLTILIYMDFHLSNSVSNQKLANFDFHVKLPLFAIFIIICSFFVELYGVKSGLIFGHYEYGTILKPQLWTVPIAIGFAWLGMILSSYAVVYQLLLRKKRMSPVIITLLMSVLMVIFDAFMEPAAIELNYWIWTTNHAPFQNYVAWFIISFIFIMIGNYTGFFKLKPTKLMFHTYFAQLIYFFMILFK